MEKSLVSIALCTYNGAAYLSQQLDTLVSQTYPNIEIIVVDDCSTDDTYTILNNYAGNYPQFKIYQNENNLGFVQNFERAVKLCTGQFIALCDQDDLWHPQKIELQVDHIKDSVLIYHDSEFIHQDGSSMGKKMSDVVNFYRGDDPLTFLLFNCVSGHAVLIKRELLNDALPLKKGYFHDWWLAYVATNIGKIDFIPQCLVQYRQHDKSDTNILGLERSIDNYKFSSVYKLEKTNAWLAACAAFQKNKNPQLIDQFYRASAKRLNHAVSFDFSRLIYKYRKSIFYIRKKGKLSRLNHIYKQIWGVNAKKLLDNN
jgi:glycosyltransferase involved in cell wall biosynthesis